MQRYDVDRRTFLKYSASALGSSAMGLYSSTAFCAIDPHSHGDRVFHATHYGPFEGIVRDGRLVTMAPMPEVDARPSAMLTHGIIDRTYDKTRILRPMVRKSYLQNWDKEDRKVELRGKEPFVPVDWDTALGLTVKAILDTIDKHGNEGIFSSSYGGWSHAGIMRPNVLQGRFFNLFGGSSVTAGDYSGGASQISLPHVIGDMEVYSAQTAWEVIRDNTEVFVLVGCDPIKNNRVEYRVADHRMHRNWEEIKAAGVRFVSINPQRTASDEVLDAEWVKITPNTDVALFLAMSQHVVAENLHDKAFLASHTVGSEKVIAYLMGEEDGTPKTPALGCGNYGYSCVQDRRTGGALRQQAYRVRRCLVDPACPVRRDDSLGDDQLRRADRQDWRSRSGRRLLVALWQWRHADLRQVDAVRIGARAQPGYRHLPRLAHFRDAQ